MIEWIKKHRIIILFIIAHVIFLIMSFLTSKIVLPDNLAFFDLRMFKGYDLSYANQIKDALPTSSINYYLYIQFPLDFIYPTVLSAFFYLYFRTYFIHKKIALLGFFTMIFDLLENSMVAIILTSNQLSESLVSFASMMTITKGIFYVINYSITLLIAIIWITKKIKKYTQESVSIK